MQPGEGAAACTPGTLTAMYSRGRERRAASISYVLFWASVGTGFFSPPPPKAQLSNQRLEEKEQAGSTRLQGRRFGLIVENCII